MKFLPAQIAFIFRHHSTRRNLALLWRFIAFLGVMITVYSVIFHFIMAEEGQRHSWVTGFYWTLTVMSTLGFGDITFASDLGRGFSILVLLSGVIFFLVVLPFTFIQFFYAPWLEAQSRMRAPRDVAEGTRGHVILTRYDPLSVSLIERLAAHGHSYLVLEPDQAAAGELHDRGVPVILGEPDDIQTYRRARASDAALVVATGDDFLNTNIAFTVRQLTPTVPIVAVANARESVDILELAGSSHVLQLTEELGRGLAGRALGGDARANIVGRFGELLIAEAPVSGTPLVGKRLVESRLRESTGLNVVGVWERGDFQIPDRETRLESSTVLVLAGSDEQLSRFAELTAIYNAAEAPVLILGGGRVGRAAAGALARRDIPYRIVEKQASRIRDPEHYVLGSAAELEVLQGAGIGEAPATLVTTNDDATNIYLTIYCRRLRPQMQIVSRATLERNVATLHRAGADFVMSYASMGANAVFNVLEGGDVVMLAEGLEVFRYPVPAKLAGRNLFDLQIRSTTGCSVVAVDGEGGTLINPPPELPLPAGAELILIGTVEGERRFLKEFGGGANPRTRL